VAWRGVVCLTSESTLKNKTCMYAKPKSKSAFIIPSASRVFVWLGLTLTLHNARSLILLKERNKDIVVEHVPVPVHVVCACMTKARSLFVCLHGNNAYYLCYLHVSIYACLARA